MCPDCCSGGADHRNLRFCECSECCNEINRAASRYDERAETENRDEERAESRFTTRAANRCIARAASRCTTRAARRAAAQLEPIKDIMCEVFSLSKIEMHVKGCVVKLLSNS